MKTATFKSRKVTCRSYTKNVGHGFEVGLLCGSRPLFVGNFLHSSEASTWYRIMNREIKNFSKRYVISAKATPTWHLRFLSNHLYRCYYQFVDRLMARHAKSFTREVSRNQRKYRTLNRNWDRKECVPFLKAA
ncbi:MAG: hypothetical protein HYR96_12060 [Deltaproteobacteria bacterium]|nr:hypothetical protein [Deltaproteobacteria bacterium]MBI3293776.1 hypothetical protein [Deltaproteobacteria bacterium]